MRGARLNFIRSQARRWSLLALFALALQWGASFGHTHALALTLATSGQTILTAPVSDHDHDHDAGRDICAICVTAAIGHALISAAPPVLPSPPGFHGFAQTRQRDFQPWNAQRAAFRSRAPPTT
jgi:hypothetical protein